MENKIQAGVFKAHCLRILDDVKKTRKEFIITKRGEPFAKIVPIEEKNVRLFGKMKGSIHILGDIVNSTDEEWDADS